jgi:hypothetical protein
MALYGDEYHFVLGKDGMALDPKKHPKEVEPEPVEVAATATKSAPVEGSGAESVAMAAQTGRNSTALYGDDYHFVLGKDGMALDPKKHPKEVEPEPVDAEPEPASTVEEPTFTIDSAPAGPAATANCQE